MSEVEAQQLAPAPAPEPFPDEPDPTPTASQSLLDDLRTQRHNLAAAKWIDLDVPGWGGKLLLRMGSVDPRRMAPLLEKAQRTNSVQASETYNADLIVLATQQVIGRNPADGTTAVVADEDGPVGIDARLAALLDIQANSARQVLYALFGGANDRAIAIGTFAQRWIEWAQGSDEGVDDAYVGESNGSAPS